MNSRPAKYGIALAALALTLPVAPFLPTAYAADDPVTNVYLSADNGDDDADGGAGDPVATLTRVRDLLADADGEAVVHVDPGLYQETELIDWSDVPLDDVSFVSTGDDPDEWPIFDGSDVETSSGMHYWMLSDEGPRLHVDHMRVRHYGTGALRLISVDGNEVTDSVFEQLGQHYQPDKSGWGALHLKDSSGNVFTGNVFQDLDDDDVPGSMHGVYAAVHSDDNQIERNTFDTITGDPVRLRSGSSGNVVRENTFRSSGNNAMVSFWRFLDKETGEPENCGTGNHVDDNHFDGLDRDLDPGQPIMVSGAEEDDGVEACEGAVDGDGNVLDD